MSLVLQRDSDRRNFMPVASERDQPLPGSQYSFEQMLHLAEAFARSGIIPGVKTPETALTVMLLCEAQGRHIGEAVTRYHVIKGVPSVKADIQLADFQARGGICKWIVTNKDMVKAEFSHPKLHPEPLPIELTMKDLMDNGVAMSWDDKKNRMALKDIYAKYPASMLRARVVTQGIKAIDPGALGGCHSTEEAYDFTDRSEPTTVTVSPTNQFKKIENYDPYVPGHNDPGPDRRPYHELVATAVATVNADLKARVAEVLGEGVEPAKTLVANDLHKHLMLRAINLGHDNGQPPSKLGEAIKRMTAVYKAQREWVRNEINSYLEDAAKAADEQIQGAFESNQPTEAEETQDVIDAETSDLETTEAGARG